MRRIRQQLSQKATIEISYLEGLCLYLIKWRPLQIAAIVIVLWILARLFVE